MSLIEKLEQERTRLNKQANDDINVVSKENHAYQVGLIGGLTNAIDIVKQNSDWVSVDERLPTENDGRVSWGVNAYKKYILVNIVSRGIAMTCRFNLTDKCFETADKVTHWCELPQPPSEVQDD